MNQIKSQTIPWHSKTAALTSDAWFHIGFHEDFPLKTFTCFNNSIDITKNRFKSTWHTSLLMWQCFYTKKFLLQHKIIWKQKKRILKSTEIYAKSCKHSSEIYAEFKNQRIILTKKIMKWHENHGNSNNIHISYKNW